MKNIDDVLKHFSRISFRGPIALIVVVGCLAYTFIPLFKVIPDTNKEIVSNNGGQLLILAGIVITWYFGSSKGKEDAEKSNQVKELLTAEKSTITTTTESPKDTPPTE